MRNPSLRWALRCASALAFVVGVAACGRTPLDAFEDGEVERVDASNDAELRADGERPDAMCVCTTDAECSGGGGVCGAPFVCDGCFCVPDPAEPPPLDCDDGFACTRDVCDPAFGCLHEVVDGDGDGELDVFCGGGDCDDTDALVSPSAREACGDRVDNNCDGLLDCADPTCRGRDECVMCAPLEFSCFDGLDEDCDGAADCADVDCAAAIPGRSMSRCRRSWSATRSAR